MDSVLDLFLGDPIYDENKQVVRRNFGIKNAVAICLTFYALYYFLPKTTILSGMSPKGSKKKGSKGKGSKGKIQKGGRRPKTIAIFIVGVAISIYSCININSPMGGADPAALGACILAPIATVVFTTMAYKLEGDTKHLGSMHNTQGGESIEQK
jgi:hypothetical protein